MSKFHINGQGIPAPCRAKKGNCPFGGEETHFSSKQEAQEHADRMNEKQHSILPGVNQSVQSESYNKMKDKMLEGDIKSVEEDMHYHKAEDVEGAYKVIQDFRKQGDLKETSNKFMKERLELSQQYADENRGIQHNLYRNTPDGRHIRDLEKEELDHIWTMDEVNQKVKENNSGNCPKCGKGTMQERKSKFGTFIGCSNFPECKHTQKKLQANPNLQKKLDELQYKHKVATKKLEDKARKMQANDPISNEIKSKMDELRAKEKIVNYIDKYQNPAKDPLYPTRSVKSDKTPIEKYYEMRKTADDAIKSKIGENNLVLNSGKMSYGNNNKLEADLKVDNKGNINNLYLEHVSKPGEVRKVQSIGEGGNLILENEENLNLMHVTNWKMRNRGEKRAPSNDWKMYTNKSKGKAYKGPKNIKYSNVDSSD